MYLFTFLIFFKEHSNIIIIPNTNIVEGHNFSSQKDYKIYVKLLMDIPNQ